MNISVAGAGAFGTALAIALSRDGAGVTLYCRDAAIAADMQNNRISSSRLPGHHLPKSLRVTAALEELRGSICLLAMPMQRLALALEEMGGDFAALVACAKGIDQTTGLGAVETIEAKRPDTLAAVLTGPSFAQDIALGLPTAIVLAATIDADAASLQSMLTRPLLRLYRTTDVIGAELGGALKNVIALAAGMAIGAGLGDSARASVIARGFAEISRFAVAKGADPETLQGLSGLGDLVLTCSSEKSRNFSAGISIGAGKVVGEQTTEGLATARPVADTAQAMGLDLPLLRTVADVVDGKLDIDTAVATLLARPVGRE